MLAPLLELRVVQTAARPALDDMCGVAELAGRRKLFQSMLTAELRKAGLAPPYAPEAYSEMAAKCREAVYGEARV